MIFALTLQKTGAPGYPLSPVRLVIFVPAAHNIAVDLTKNFHPLPLGGRAAPRRSPREILAGNRCPFPLGEILAATCYPAARMARATCCPMGWMEWHGYVLPFSQFERKMARFLWER